MASFRIPGQHVLQSIALAGEKIAGHMSYCTEKSSAATWIFPMVNELERSDSTIIMMVDQAAIPRQQRWPAMWEERTQQTTAQWNNTEISMWLKEFLTIIGSWFL
jgi:hypothetical protein